MFDKKIIKQSLACATAALLYIVLVATFMSNVGKIVGQQDKSALAPIGFLLLLVVSAATMGLLIFGKPVMLYMDGKKRESVAMVVGTIACLAVFTVLLFIALVLLV